MVEIENIIGLEIVGFRYGVAPEEGRSYNCAENSYECGVSMASVGYIPESDRHSNEYGDRKRYYYIGTISGTGGDDEICLSNVRRISYSEYLKKRKECVSASNMVVNYKCDTKKWLLNNGYIICQTYDQIESERNKLLRK